MTEVLGTLAGPRVAVLFPAAGRTERRQLAIEGAGPKEFFYGSLTYEEIHRNTVFGDTRAIPDSPFGSLAVNVVRVRNAVTNFGLAKPRVAALKGTLADVDIALSFTDAFSISLGYYRQLAGNRAILAGGFHGLCDMVEEVKAPFRSFAQRAIRRGLQGLDLSFFFGPADREEAIRRYGLARERTYLFRFGVDTDFWCPGPANLPEADFVFAAGSDPKRDYDCLMAVPLDVPLRILTRRRVPGAEARSKVRIFRGSYHDMAVTDLVLRDLYRAAEVVVVPVRDVFQPSGYSVTLQAMACGKPVILSRIKGLWDPEVFDSGINCILVEPGNQDDMARAIQRLIDDPHLRIRIGAAARETALKSFNLERMNRGLEEMILHAICLGRRELEE